MTYLFHLFHLFCSVFLSFVFTSNVLLILPILLCLLKCLMILILHTGSSLTCKPPRKWILLELAVRIYWLVQVAHFRAQLLMYHHRFPSPWPAYFFESQDAPGTLPIRSAKAPCETPGGRMKTKCWRLEPLIANGQEEIRCSPGCFVCPIARVLKTAIWDEI